MEDGLGIVFLSIGLALGIWMMAERELRQDHPSGTDYVAHVMHKNNADRSMHEEMGFYDGWGTVAEQLAKLADRS